MRQSILGAVLLLTLLAGRGGQAVGKEESQDLSEGEAKRLVAEAASVSKPFLNTVASLGSKLTPADLMGPQADVPLTLAVVLLMTQPGLDERDLKLHRDAAPGAFAEALFPQEIRAGRRVPKHPQASIVHPEYVHDLELHVADHSASGTVHFRVPGVYEGSLGFVAYRHPHGWQVQSLFLRHSGVRTTLKDGRWSLSVGGKARAPVPRRGAQLKLPRVGTVGILPPHASRIHITVTRDGWIRVADNLKPLSLEGLQAYLRAKSNSPRLREPDGASRLNAVLEIDESIPWAITQWIMQTCAHPATKIYKIWLSAETPEGCGAIATLLPKDRSVIGTPNAPRDFIKHKLKVFKLERFSQASDMRALYAALKKRHDATGARSDSVFEIVAPPPKGGAVPHGYVVQMVDVCLALGAGKLVFEGAATPRSGDLTRSAEALKHYIDAVRKQPGVPSVKLNNNRAFVAPDADDLPAVPARGLLEQAWGAGMFQALAGLEEELEEVEEEILEEEMPDEPEIREPKGMDEPVKEDVVEEESFGETEGLSDAPFEGPANNGSIGIGGGAGGAFRQRGGQGAAAPDFKALAKSEDDAVDAALRWLAAHQSPNGGWPAAGFDMWCDGKPVSDGSKRPGGPGKALYDVGVTGLALQAFLGAGHTNRGRHPFAKVVSRGLRYLKNVQDPEGCFGPRSTQQYVYNHAMAAVAMVEAYGMTGSPIFKGAAQRALDFGALSRNPYFAWRYGIKPGDNDTSVSGWMMRSVTVAQLINADAKRRGKKAPLTLDETTANGMRAWLDKVTDPKTGRVGYVQRGTGPARTQELVDRFPGTSSESMTAVGVLSRIHMGEDPQQSDVIRKGIALMQTKPPVWDTQTGSIDMYYWHWGALAMFQAGDKAFGLWRKAMTDAIVERQRQDGGYCEHKGSWDPVGPWGPDGGRVYSTALMALCLEARYRYARVFEVK